MNAILGAIFQRPRSVLTVLVALLAAGILAYVSVPKEANPDIDIPVFYVSVSQPGISAEDAERLLVRPLETKLQGLDGLKEMTGIASESHGSVLLEFDVDFDKDAVLADIRAQVDQAQSQLPADAEEAQVHETNFSLMPTIVVALSGNVPERTLYRHALDLQDAIEGIPTVLEANLAGHREELLEVLIDANRLEAYGITQDELFQAVTRNNQLVPAGALDSGAGRFNVKVPGLFETAADVTSLPIKVDGDTVVTLGQVADIRRTFKDATSFSRFNGKPAIALQVVKRTGTNIIENNQAVRDVVAEETAEWPSTINVDFTLDLSNFINDVLGGLQSSIMTAIALVMVVVVAALGLRSGLLVGLSIPTSFMIGFLIIELLGMSVNMMVMFGLVLTVGMLVDGSIVVIEYADRKMADGLHRREAYKLASQRMFWPIFSSTATTLAAFLPMLLWPGVSGEFMSYLPIMVVIILSASLPVAMIFLPVLGSLIGKAGANSAEDDEARRLDSAEPIDWSRMRGFTGAYIRALRFFAGWRLGHILIIAGMAVLTIAVFDLYGKHNSGVEFFVDEEPDQVVALVRGRGNLSAYEQRDLVIDVEDQVLQVAGISNVFTTIGDGSGEQRVGGVQDKPADVIGEMMIELDDYCCRRTADKIFAEIRERVGPIPGIIVELREMEGGPPTGKDIRLELTDTNYERVKAQAARVRAHLETAMSDLRDIEDSRPLPGIEWEMAVDREEAGRFGTDVSSVGGMIQLVTNGILVGDYRPDDSDEEVDIRVRLPADERSIDRLDALRITTPAGTVPLSNLVTREAQPKVSSITRQNGRYAIDVKANVVTENGVTVDEKVNELRGWLDQQEWPATTRYRFRGADEEQKEAQAFLGQAAGAALFIMFIILVTQFNSFYQTILTLSTVVMSVLGVLIGMMVTGQKFSVIMTGTGIVALAGIVVNNSIVLMDTYNQLREEHGVTGLDAVLRTCAQRLRPIMLTTVTTIMGLVPMALQVTFDFFAPAVQIGSITSVWWVQLSTAVIFGLGFSTILTLIVIPTMLALPSVWAERWHGWRARLKAKKEARGARHGTKPADAGPLPAPGYREAAE